MDLPFRSAVFDSLLLRQRRDRAAPSFAAHSFLHALACERLRDRLPDIKRTFPLAAFIGARTGGEAPRWLGQNGIAYVVRVETSAAMARGNPHAGVGSVVAGSACLPFAAGSLDLTFSVFDLHWLDDVEGTLRHICTTLKPDGLFLGCFAGGHTLHELRTCLTEAEVEVRGGAWPRISPMIQSVDAAYLLQRAGFALPVVDTETLTVDYPSCSALLADLRGMGATSVLQARARYPLSRTILARALELYALRFPGATPGTISATFEMIFMTGWAPSPHQPQPLKPGSAQHHLSDLLKDPTGFEEKTSSDLE